MPQGNGGRTGEGAGVVERTSVRTQRPSFYVVVVHNDSITPRGFVIYVLQKFFHKQAEEAKRVMLLAHNFGVGVVASYTHEIAESKAKQVNQYSRDQGYPLFFSVQEE